MTIFISEILFKKFINLKKNEAHRQFFILMNFLVILQQNLYSAINTIQFKITENIFL